MSPDLFIKTGGVLHLLLALVHVSFWRFLRWKDELPKLMRLNRGVVQVLNIQLTYVFLAISAMSLLFSRDMTATSIGRFISAAICLFWLLRLLEQAIFFRVRHWLVIAFNILFAACAGAYGLALAAR